MERKVYADCAKTMVNKLCDKINGKITFEIYPEIDTIIFKIVFTKKTMDWGKTQHGVTTVELGEIQ